MTDFRALCTELFDKYDLEWRARERIKAALAEPEPPAYGEVEELVAGELVRQLRTKAATEKANRCHYSAALLTRAANLLSGPAPQPVADGPAVSDDREPASVNTQPSDAEIEEWADACPEAPLEEMDPEVHGWRRCFTAKEFSETIRAAIARWSRPAELEGAS